MRCKDQLRLVGAIASLFRFEMASRAFRDRVVRGREVTVVHLMVRLSRNARDCCRRDHRVESGAGDRGALVQVVAPATEGLNEPCSDLPAAEREVIRPRATGRDRS